MKQALLTVLVALLPLSCASIRDDLNGCIADWETEQLLVTLEKAADSNAKTLKAPVTQTTLVEQSCNRRVFQRSGHRLLVFNKPHDREGMVRGTLSAMDKKVRTLECLERAQKELGAFGRESYHNVVAEHRRRFDWMWTDLDIGPVKWLQCDKKEKISEWYYGINTFVHELNHENGDPDCTYDPENKQQLCWDIPNHLPKAKAAHVAFISPDRKDQWAFEGTQKTYFGLDQTAFQIFEEMNSYILSLQELTDAYKRSGKKAFTKKTRPRAQLPLFLAYSTRYLEVLNESSNSTYLKYFGPETQNRANLEKLWKRADAAYAEWLTVLKDLGDKPSFLEEDLWLQYQAGRRNFSPQQSVVDL